MTWWLPPEARTPDVAFMGCGHVRFPGNLKEAYDTVRCRECANEQVRRCRAVARETRVREELRVLAAQLRQQHD